MRWSDHNRFLLALALPCALGGAGCVTPGDGDPGMDDASTSDDPGSTSQSEDTDMAEDGEDESSSGSFIEEPEQPPPACSVWTQDCPQGEKCMPWANDGGITWNSLKCVEIRDNPGEPGDGCTVEGNGTSGVDTCNIGSMCWGVDPETNEGTCVAMCGGDQEAPLCEDPDSTCVIVNDGVLTICLDKCDPLLQSCDEGQACYPANSGFACAPDASGPELGTAGDPCQAINGCDVGLFCAPAAAVPGCTDSARCCSDFCDLSADDPTDDCFSADLGQECIPFFEDGQAPPDLQAVGGCALPLS